MPAKRIILLTRPPNVLFYQYVLWADVPAGNQIAYRNPAAISAYVNATPTELQALRDGTVVERVGTIQSDSTTLSAVQTLLQPIWTEFQALITAETPFVDYGRYWDSGAVWQASLGVPLYSIKEVLEGLPAFTALTPVSAFAANKFQFVLFNGQSTTLGQACVIKIRLVVFIPGLAAATSVAPSAWTLQRRQGLTTNPSGAGSFAPALMDSAMAIPTGISAFNAPAVSPAGGTTSVFSSFFPQADEVKLSTLDAPTMASLAPFGGQLVYSADALRPARPLTIRAGETLEVVQTVTGGTGNGQILCVFTVG